MENIKQAVDHLEKAADILSEEFKTVVMLLSPQQQVADYDQARDLIEQAISKLLPYKER